ncbi:MAG: tRNA preQ1(34) S-adenosylmethionine ribosyltransferase-isomerase QueA [Candidatus Magasanikbacteria bacterium]
MLTSDFDYNLPEDLIAQSPVTPRDFSRLMIVDKDIQKINHKHFYDIVDYLSKGDLLVWNNTKVFKARLKGTIELDQQTDDIPGEVFSTNRILNTPKHVEIFLVRPMENPGVWRVLAKPGRKLRLGMRVKFAPDFSCEVITKEKDGTLLMQFSEEDFIVREKANKYGEVPTPPYVTSKHQNIKTSRQLSEQYQTVYAISEGSVAAPTAGFHFTVDLIEKLKVKGVEFAEITLHVGLGTFLPVKSERVEDHHMHGEWVELTDANAQKINAAKSEGRRVIAVGTTTVRTLEAVALLPVMLSKAKHPLMSKMDSSLHDNWLRSYSGDINIFITPGFKFQVVDALITNFHLPKSTLIMLVSAFVSDREFLLKCYKEAVEQKYRFYSFGDAMLVK